MLDEPEQIIRVVGPPPGNNRFERADDTAVDRAEMTAGERWESLLWDSSDGGPPILRNLFGTRDRGELAKLEYNETALRAVDIACGLVELPRTADILEWQAIHRHLFANVYSWAGQLRDVDLLRHGQPALAHRQVRDSIDATTQRVRSIDWAELTEDQFIDQVASTSMALTYTHPFRAGNGRTTRIFLDRLIAEAPWELDYNLIDPAAWRLAHYATHPTAEMPPAGHQPLIPVIAAITVERAHYEIELEHQGGGDITITLTNNHNNSAPGRGIGEAIDAAGLTSPFPDTQTRLVAENTSTAPGRGIASRPDRAPEVSD